MTALQEDSEKCPQHEHFLEFFKSRTYKEAVKFQVTF